MHIQAFMKVQKKNFGGVAISLYYSALYMFRGGNLA